MENEELKNLLQSAVKDLDIVKIEKVIFSLENEEKNLKEILEKDWGYEDAQKLTKVQENIAKANDAIHLIDLVEDKKDMMENEEKLISEIEKLEDERKKLEDSLNGPNEEDVSNYWNYEDAQKLTEVAKAIREKREVLESNQEEREKVEHEISDLSEKLDIKNEELEPEIVSTENPDLMSDKEEQAEEHINDEETEPQQLASTARHFKSAQEQTQPERPASTARHFKTAELQAEQEAEKVIQDEIETLQSGMKENSTDKYLIDMDSIRQEHKILNWISNHIPVLGKLAEKRLLTIAYGAYAKKREEYRKPIEDAIKESTEKSNTQSNTERETAEAEQSSHRTPEGQKFAESLNPESGEYHMQDVQESVTQPRDTERTESTDIEINEK